MDELLSTPSFEFCSTQTFTQTCIDISCLKILEKMDRNRITGIEITSKYKMKNSKQWIKIKMQLSCFQFATKYTTILHSKTLNEWSWLYTETLDSALQEAIHRGQQVMVSKPAAIKNLRIPVSLTRESKAWCRLESVLEKKKDTDKLFVII